MATVDVSDPAREVLNQPPPLQPIDLFESDLALREALEREGGEWGVEARPRCRRRGRQRRGARARPPRRAQRAMPAHPRPLRQPGRRGRAGSLVALAAARRRSSAASTASRGVTPTTRRARRPRGAVHAVRQRQRRRHVPGLDDLRGGARRCATGAPELAAEWEPRLTSNDYERGALAGMAMTERQGGSDVRANITRAEPVGDGAYEIHGHKWFCSYPPCDVFLVLAQAPGGLSCFLVERGPGMEFQRLKDKLGTRSLPSSEVEFHGIEGRLVGEEGRGVPAIIRMVNHTRLDCLLGSTTGLRRGTVEAIHHARHRSRVRRAARRPAGDAQRARRPRDRVRGRDGDRDARRPQLRRAGRGERVPAVRHRGHEVLGRASAPRPMRPRRSSAWAATGSSRSPACRCCTATRR